MTDLSRPLVVLLGSLLALTGCSSGRGPEADPTPSVAASPGAGTTSSPADLATAYCERLLPLGQVSGLAGREMGEATVVPIAATPGCTWSSTDDSRTSVQVVNASSSTWGASLPQLTSSLRSAGVTLSPETESDLATTATAVAQGHEPDADLVCEIFEQLAATRGYGSGTDATLTAKPDTAAPTRVVGEACNADEYSLVQLSGPDLAEGLDARLAEVGRLLQQVHGAPLTVGTLP